jgi:hypothetical protein
VASRGVGVVKIVIATGVVTTIPTTTGFNFTHGITTDGTNLFVTEDVTFTVKKIVISTGVVSTIAGSGTPGSADGTGTAASFEFPAGITSDGTYLYMADESNGKIRKIGISTGIVTTIASGFSTPGYLTTDGTTLYVTDRTHHIIKKIF